MHDWLNERKNCVRCGMEFAPNPKKSLPDWQRRQYCSSACSMTARWANRNSKAYYTADDSLRFAAMRRVLKGKPREKDPLDSRLNDLFYSDYKEFTKQFEELQRRLKPIGPDDDIVSIREENERLRAEVDSLKSVAPDAPCTVEQLIDRILHELENA